MRGVAGRCQRPTSCVWEEWEGNGVGEGEEGGGSRLTGEGRWEEEAD